MQMPEHVLFLFFFLCMRMSESCFRDFGDFGGLWDDFGLWWRGNMTAKFTAALKDIRLTSHQELCFCKHSVRTGLGSASILPSVLQQNAPNHQIHRRGLLQLRTGKHLKKKKRGRHQASLNEHDTRSVIPLTTCRGSCGLRNSCLIQVLAWCYILQLLVFSVCWNEKGLRQDWE